MPSPLERIRSAYSASLFYSEDDLLAIDGLMSVYLANTLEQYRESVWLHLVSPPSSGKTENLNPLRGLPWSVFPSEMTANALASGYSDDDGNDPSLLRILHRKNLIIKDMTNLASNDEGHINKLFGVLRDAYDGYYAKASGVAGLREYVAQFGVIAAVTPIIDTFLERHQQLGERFLGIRMCRFPWSPQQEVDTLIKVQGSLPDKVAVLGKLRDTVHAEIKAVRAEAVKSVFPTMSDKHRRQVAVLAYLLAQLRTTPVDGSPSDAEKGYRLQQQLINLGHCHAMLDGRSKWTDMEVDLLRRVVQDTLSPQRSRIIRCLYQDPKSYPSWTISQIAYVCKAATLRVDEIVARQYAYLGIVKPGPSVGNKASYTLSPVIRDLIDEVNLFGAQK